jgi:hypothetical protein
VAAARKAAHRIAANPHRRPHLRVEGGTFRERIEKLIVGFRDCTKLADGVLNQVALVQGAPSLTIPSWSAVPVVDGG